MLQGWPLVGTVAMLIALPCLAIVLAGGGQVDDLRLVIRITARTSLVLFCLAFTASALVRQWPGTATRWLRRNRRYVGVSFAASHGLHAIAIVAFAMADPVRFNAQVPLPTLIGGGFAYVLIAAMVATSFDRTAALIGPRAWKILHTVGSYYVWIVFFQGFAKRSVDDPFYLVPAAVVIAAMVIRWMPAITRRRAAA
ncbi:hypothetical protein D3874_07630 [Oleomonas cavernae]|uniref:Ferric oxidoreductase domain-containing protein n=1 Tax=Oleomonas cavernae TaxID=2320859 RepID=A0A418WA68_9PROT|nr:hypothetical protein D3874_07630 [Oleomonas cavernae]